MPLELDGQSLTLETVASVARRERKTVLSAQARQKVEDCHALLRRMIKDGTPIYGVTTGFGALDGRPVPAESNRAQQHNLLKSHAAGIGQPMRDDEVRAMMLIRANVLATGLTGVSMSALEALLAMLNAGIVPHVPRRGSVGACGDLAPLAHMVLPMIGFGKAKLKDGAWLPGGMAFSTLGIAKPPVDGRDGIALINGTEQTTGIGVLAAYDAWRLVRMAEAVSAMSLEVLGGVSDAFDERVALAKPHPGQIATSEALRYFTAGSQAVLPPRPSRLRDGLSLRCIPQVLGASRDAVEHATHTLEIEINAANDNPIFGLADGFVTSNSGNFHGQRAGEVLDMLATSISSLAIISERRAARLVDEKNSGGLPAFLIHPEARQGENSGFMIAQYTAASLVAELRMRSVPASLQSVPTCANTEDHVPMSPLAAERAAFAVDTAETIVAIEALLAAQAYDLRGLTPAPALLPIYKAIRERVPAMIEDREMGDDIAATRKALAEIGQTLFPF